MNAISKLVPTHNSRKSNNSQHLHLIQQQQIQQQQLSQKQQFSGSDDKYIVDKVKMREVQFELDEIVADEPTFEDVEDEEDSENIPYHARQHAKPFTYGALPEGFKTSELNHVEIIDQNDQVDSSKSMRAQSSQKPSTPSSPTSPLPSTAPLANATTTFVTNSPKSLRRPLRPSISPSRPVLHKTPTREEFEEMLMERREQALREQNNIIVKLAQDAAIRKDLDQLHEKLNRDGVLKATNSAGDPMERLRHVETVDLPNVNEKALVRAFEPALILTQTPSEEQQTSSQAKRSETPDFPLVTTKAQNEERCTSPYPAIMPPSAATKDDDTNSNVDNIISLPTAFNYQQDIKQPEVNRNNDAPQVVMPHMVKFAKDSSEYWYKPHMTREQAVNLLRNAAPGNFIIRNSTTYRDAYGLVLRVDRPPPGVVVADDSQGDELVRHYLLEPTTQGVRLKGCPNVFTSLSALVYQYSIKEMALPCKLIIPDRDLVHSSGDMELIAAQKQLLTQGAACNVLYLFTCETEMLTGDEAIRKAINEMYQQRNAPKPVEVHFKVSQQGITLTDNKRQLFFRRHYMAQNISHISIDPDNHFWTVVSNHDGLERSSKKTIFAFVARPLVGAKDNQCHVFCDLASNTQPASAIISFAHKVLPLNKQHHKLL